MNLRVFVRCFRRALDLTENWLPLHKEINPLFPAIRSGHRLFQRPSPGKQFPSNNFLAIITT
jgi:hypothetical protein